MVPLRQREVVVDLDSGIAHDPTSPCVHLIDPHRAVMLPINCLDDVAHAGYATCGYYRPEV